MESEVYNALSTKDREILGTLFETESAQIIAKAGDIYQQNKAVHIALMAPDMENVILNRGNIQGARFLYDLMKYAHSKMKKEQKA